MYLTKEELEEIMSHFPYGLSQEIVDYGENVALLRSRYIFTQRSGSGQQYGYCTHCKKQYKTANLKHKDLATCQNCHSKCKVQASGRGRKYLRDDAYFVWYEKSIRDPRVLTARGIYVIRDYSENYHEVETKYRITSMYVFENGQSRMIERYAWNDLYWRERKSIISESGTSMQNIACYCSHESIAVAVKGTHFQYSTWEEYLEGDMLKFFDLAAKYPCIEYLTKLGLSGLVQYKLDGRRTFAAVNWRGKTIDKVLRLTKQDLKHIQTSSIEVTPFALYLFQQSRKDGSNLSFEEADQISNFVGECFLDDLKPIKEYATLRQIFRYLSKQYNRKDRNQHYMVHHQILTTWRDYINDCLKLEMDIQQESVLFPKNLYQAHQNTIKQVKVKGDQELNRKIAVRVKLLTKYRFETLGFMLRPVASSQELIDEGKALHHCVGTYADRYAKGETNLFVIRKASQPNKPFYTMEIKNNRIVQTRGLKNCLPTEEVQNFIDAFVEDKLTKKRKSKVTARQEVAV